MAHDLPLDAAPTVTPDLLEHLLERAKRAGATDASATGTASRALSASVRDGALQGIGHAERGAVTLGVYVGRKTASQTTSDLSPEGLERLVEETVAAAQAGAEDPYAGLPPEGAALSGDDLALELRDPWEPTTADLRAWALEAESAARETPGVVLSEGGSASWNVSYGWAATSRGVRRSDCRTGFNGGVAVIAGDGVNREIGHKGTAGVWRDQLQDFGAIGAEAGRNAVEKLGGRKVRSGPAPVIFDRTVAFHLLNPFLGALNGAAVFRKQSFLIGRLGDQVFPQGLEIVADPHVVRGRGSRPVDGDALPVRRRPIVEDGRAVTWLLDCTSARQLGLDAATDAHARGLFNLTVEPGEKTRDGLMRDAGTGLIVTSTFSPSLNPHTGDWSMGVGGFWFEQGEIQHAVSEVTVAGNMLEFYRTLTVGSDLVVEAAANCPSLLVERMTISGT